MDDNVDKHLALSGIYDEAIEKTRQQQQLAEIKRHVEDTLADLQDRARQIREVALTKERKTRAAQSMASLFLGSKTDYLVRKFVNKLKMKIRERKDLTIIEQNEKLIENILKKKAFNENF